MLAPLAASQRSNRTPQRQLSTNRRIALCPAGVRPDPAFVTALNKRRSNRLDHRRVRRVTPPEVNDRLGFFAARRRIVCSEPASINAPAEGVQAQIRELFGRFRLPLHRHLVAMVGRTGEAEELTQEAFLKLYDHLASGETVDDARNWLFRVARNLAIDVIRRRRHIAPLDVDAWSQVCDQWAQPAEQEHRLLNREARRRLAAALTSLTVQEREALTLRAEGLRYREIAQLMDLTYAAAVDSLRRGIAKLTRAVHD